MFDDKLNLKSAGILASALALLVSAPWELSLRARPSGDSGPPATRTDNVIDDYHGVQVADPYRWLEDQQSPETRAWIDAQNKYTDSLLDAWPQKEELKRQVSGLLKIDAIGMPREQNGRAFFTKRAADQDQAVLCVRKSAGGEDEVLLDPNSLSADHSTSVLLKGVSEDGTLIAYGLRHGGEDEVAIHLMDVDRRADLADVLPKARYFTISIQPDKSGLYYAVGGRTPRVYHHTMGADPAKDEMVFGEGLGAEVIVFAELSDGGRYLILHVVHGSSADQTEIYAQDLRSGGPIKPVVTGIAARFFGQVGGDTLFVDTNWNAPHNRILAIDLRNPARDKWKEIVPEDASVLEATQLAGGKIIAVYSKNASSLVRVFEAQGKRLRDVPLPGIGTVDIGGRWASDQAFYGYSSFHVPLLIQQYDVATGSQKLWAQEKVPIHSDRFEVKQVWFNSKDGTRVPMFILGQKGMKLDGSRPTLVTGYGGFNDIESPEFSPLGALWVENGGVYVVVTLRGGGEFGEDWHRAGMLGKKQNVFDDFISAAEWLIQNHYTQPAHRAIAGASNAGLLVGAALTQRPDLYRAVLCLYPLLDMLRYENFLAGQYWVTEYGTAKNPDQFKYLAAYSPYHNVKPGVKYPAVLLVSGDGDTRVAPLHARKMTALLQASTGSDRPILLHYDTQAGHSAGIPVSKQIDQMTDEAGFLFWQLQMKVAP